MQQFSAQRHARQVIAGIIILLFLTTSAHSQFQGVKAGLNVSSVRAEGSQGPLAAYYAGVAFKKILSQKVSLKNEFIYSLQGAKALLNSRVRFHYLNVPILLAIGSDKITFDTGPQIGILLNAVETFEGKKNNVTAAFRIIDLSYCVGGSYHVTDALTMQARMNVGLTNNSSFYPPSSNMVFQLGLQYTLADLRNHE